MHDNNQTLSETSELSEMQEVALTIWFQKNITDQSYLSWYKKGAVDPHEYWTALFRKIFNQ